MVCEGISGGPRDNTGRQCGGENFIYKTTHTIQHTYAFCIFVEECTTGLNKPYVNSNLQKDTMYLKGVDYKRIQCIKITVHVNHRCVPLCGVR